MSTFTWNTTNGAFNVGTNWIPAGPPGTADTAAFGSGSGTISGTGNVASLQLNPGGPWTWTGTVTASNYTVNDATTLSTGAVWTIGGTPASNNYMVIGSGSGGSGSLTVTNGASIVSTQPGSTSAYSLYVGSGSVANATGVLTVTGAGSSVNTGPNGAAVGEAGTGTLDIEAGATATFTSPSSAAISALAVGRGGTGTVKVSGAGSTLTANGYVYIGRQGTGTLLVDQGGTFTGGAAATGSTNSYATVIGDGTSLLDQNGNPVATAYFGGSSTAQVLNGSTLHSLGNLAIGNNGSTGTLTVDGASSVASSDLIIALGSGTARQGGKGTLIVQNGGTARSGSAANGSAEIVIGSQAGTTGTATVTGATSLLTAGNYRITVGSAGTGTLTISNGGRAVAGSSGYTDTEAALAVASNAAGGGGTLSITGAGSQFIASGVAVIGGNNIGNGIVAGGAGTVTVTSGGALQTGAMTIETGSSLTVDQSSTLTVPTMTINGGTADLARFSSATAVSFGSGGTLRLHAVTGNNTIGNFTFGDKIDFANTTSVALSGNTVTGGGGTLTLATASANASYQVINDGNGGEFVALEPTTIGVYRFFDSSTGTHFYTADPNEDKTVLANRPDLVPEGPGGVGLQAIAVAGSDPNAAPVYRFFDTVYGTHFFTASATERDSIIASRPDLTYEPNSTFYEHTTQQPGDVAVYRFFDNVHGTHFYTDSPSEQAGILANRPDLVSEGIGFYEPPQNYAAAPMTV